VYDLACAVQPSNNLKTNDFCREYGNLTQKFAFGVSNFKTFLELFAFSLVSDINGCNLIQSVLLSRTKDLRMTRTRTLGSRRRTCKFVII